MDPRSEGANAPPLPAVPPVWHQRAVSTCGCGAHAAVSCSSGRPWWLALHCTDWRWCTAVSGVCPCSFDFQPALFLFFCRRLLGCGCLYKLVMGVHCHTLLELHPKTTLMESITAVVYLFCLTSTDLMIWMSRQVFKVIHHSCFNTFFLQVQSNTRRQSLK